MTTYPKPPALRAPIAIADHGRQVQRAHARLDQVESTQNQQVTQIANNTTAIGAVTSGTGGTTAQDFLGKLATAAVASSGAGGTIQADFLASLGEVVNYVETATGGWTTGGALQAGSWDATHVNALVPWMNQVTADIGAILTALRNAGIMA